MWQTLYLRLGVLGAVSGIALVVLSCSESDESSSSRSSQHTLARSEPSAAVDAGLTSFPEPAAVHGGLASLAEPATSPPQPAQSTSIAAASSQLASSGFAQASSTGFASTPPSWQYDREQYLHVEGNQVHVTAEQPVSTFSVDVDTAAYANVRRFLRAGRLPPSDAVRTEELVNYFDYDYAVPGDPVRPFGVDLALFDAPWDADRQLLRIGLQAYELDRVARPPMNLVFLVDTSGSMNSPEKLPLVQQSFKMLARSLAERDRVSIVTYADEASTVLEAASGGERSKILGMIDSFEARGSTAGARAIQTAYELAEAEFTAEATNRVILATDGDFNVGISDPELLAEFIAEKRETGVYLSILGFGTGNLNDHLMQKLAQAGNGNAAYIDSVIEAKKVLVDEIGATLTPIANDVKVQVEFNPGRVAEYRLIGYETRLLQRPDFNDDRIDAGEVGSGHAVTAIYEITSPDSPARLVDDLRYRDVRGDSTGGGQDEIAWLRLRYKLPGAAESSLIEQPVPASIRTGFDEASDDARFAAAVAGFGRLLRQDSRLDEFSFDDVHRIARSARGEDPQGIRSEFMRLSEAAAALSAVN